MSTPPRLVVATDGSALGNPGPAGWAWAAAAPDGGVPRVWAAGGIGHNTNNAAELTALVELLRACPAEVALEVRMDSQYALNAAASWRHGWKRRGWRTASGSPVKNQQLMVALDGLLTGRDVTFVWVKAHQRAGRGDALNEFVDARARAAATAVSAGTPAPGGPGWPAR